MTPTDPLSHPMHINNVRARNAADQAEQDMFRDLAREIAGPPPPGIGTLLKRALQPAPGQGVTDGKPYSEEAPS